MLLRLMRIIEVCITEFQNEQIWILVQSRWWANFCTLLVAFSLIRQVPQSSHPLLNLLPHLVYPYDSCSKSKKPQNKQNTYPQNHNKQTNHQEEIRTFPSKVFKVILYKKSRFKKKLTLKMFLNDSSMQNKIIGLQHHQNVMLMNISTNT